MSQSVYPAKKMAAIVGPTDSARTRGTMTKKIGIHWFRRDLRIAGNQILRHQQKLHQGKVLGIFTFDKNFLSRPDFSVNRFQFFLETLKSLKDDLQKRGGDLLVLDVGPENAFSIIFDKLPKQFQVTVSWNRDYEPFARARDQKLTGLFSSFGWQSLHQRDHLLFEPHEICSKSKTPFKIYTPFAKEWFRLLHSSEGKARIEAQMDGIEFIRKHYSKNSAPLFCLKREDLFGDASPQDHLDHYLVENKKHTTINIPKAGVLEAWSSLTSFQDRLDAYAAARDFPSHQGTSGLSVFLKNGTLTVPQIIAALDLTKTQFTEKSGSSQFLKELVWREFYYHILWHFPETEKRSFIEKYNQLPWENDPDYFEAWKDGKTGYPIVDAAMRQLKTTGLMHNRARMIVASFLTKDLHIDWKWGERWFMNQLLDGDLAPNNGGWQWAASTGCDPQPYFRIFNPSLQSERFDPEGTYIKTYVEELKKVSQDEIHNPSEKTRQKVGYPDPLITHKVRALRAQQMYKDLK